MASIETTVQDTQLPIAPEQENIINSWRDFKPYNSKTYNWNKEEFDNIPYSKLVDTDKLHLLLTPKEKLDYNYVNETLKNDLPSLMAVMTLLNNRFNDKKGEDIKKRVTFTQNEELLMFSGFEFLKEYNEKYNYENPYIGQLIAESKKLTTRYNIGLVIYTINNKYKPVSEEERKRFFSAGTTGLKRAIDSFNPKYGNRFSAYGVRAIKTALIKERYENRIIKLPDYLRSLLSNYDEIEKKFFSNFGTEPTTREILEFAEENGFDLPNKKTLDHIKRTDVLSLETELLSGDKTLLDTISTNTDYNSNFDHEILKEKLISLINQILPERSAKILMIRYGINGYGYNCSKPLTYSKIGEIFNLSRERIRQILRESEKELRNHPDIQALKI